MHTGLFTLLVAGMLVRTGLVGELSGAIRPPSSLQPSPRPQPSNLKRTVRVSHRSQRVRKCDVLKTRDEFSCVPQLEEADSATTVSFRHVALPDSTADSASAAVVVSFPNHVGLQEQNTGLVLGEWAVDWPGERALKRMQVGDRSELSVALKTTSGRCEVHHDRCRLIGGVINRQVAVTDGGH